MQQVDFSPAMANRVAGLRAAFASGRTKPLSWRVKQLRALKALLTDKADDICAALWSDLRKSPLEAEVSEQGFVVAEIEYTLANLARWLKPRSVRVPLISQPGRARIVHEPLGVVLIIGAWNYPVNVLLAPLVGAVAGGNAALLKPSEAAPATSETIARLVPQYLDSEAIAVIEGGPAEAQALLEEKLDHIFFTGSAAGARTVLEKAARHLTPVTLELGGKSPCLVDEDADLAVAARRIAWGKFINAGQTCVAPDYVLVHSAVEEQLLAGLHNAIREFYGDDPRRSPDFCRIVNGRNFERLKGLLSGGQIFCGGETDAGERYIAPTILRNVPFDAPVMQEEIFGPILPVIPVPDMNAAIEFVNSRPKPLVLYLFSSNRSVTQDVLERTSSGNVSINDVVLHLTVPELPFGGVGSSGMGRYHGRWSFDTFTHAKGILHKSVLLDLPIRYPPYTESRRQWLHLLL
jgi:aldehyde dehydrogenase (NAD+)